MTAPVAAKVKTSSAAAGLVTLLSGLVVSDDLKQALTATAVALLTAGTTFAVGWLTKHTPR